MIHTLPKFKLFILIFSVIAIQSHAQWVSIAQSYNGTIANDGAVSFAINGIGYLVCGSSTDQIYSYDSLQNSWAPYGTAPVGMGQAFAMSFVINDKAYVIGGDTGGVPLNTVWKFDPANTMSPWTQKNNFPPGARDAGFAFSLNNSGYVGSGFDGTNIYNDIWKYDQPNDSWTQLPASVPISGLIFPSSFVSGNKAFILLGGTSSGVNETNKMWCLDGSNDSLYSRANFPGAARQAAFAFGNAQYGFAGGGQAGYMTNYLNAWMYDVANDQWSPIPDVPLIGGAWSSTFTLGNNGYVGLGAKFVGAGLQGDDHFYKYNMDVSTGLLETKNQLNKWSVYPNPVSDFLFINGEFSSDAKIMIYDGVGKVILQSAIPANQKLWIGDFENGFYTISVIDKNSTDSRKFVK